MELEFDVHVDANALYDYMLRHTFTKAAGILGSTAGALGIVAGMMQRYPIYVIFGAVVYCISRCLYGCVRRNRRCFPFLRSLFIIR